MLLVATWRAVDQNRQKEWQFQTPLGPAMASLKENGKAGSLVMSVDVSAGAHYTDPGRFSAIGALVFLESPQIRGTSTKLRLTAIPPAWLNSPESIISFLNGVGLSARILGRTLEVTAEKISPTPLLTRTALAVFSLDSFSKRLTPEKDFSKLRKEAIATFRDDGHELYDYLDDIPGTHALRALLNSRRVATISRPKPDARSINSDDTFSEIQTGLGRAVRLEQEQWESTRETFSRWTVDPHWLIYLPPGMCSVQNKTVTGPLEHPTSAFDYYRNELIEKVVVEFKHMGSRAIVIVCRDEAAAKRRFGTSGIGCIYTRNGRPFFEDPTELLLKIRAGVTRARFWDKFKTDWACFDGECLPWTLKADNLIDNTHRQLLASAEALFEEISANRSLLPAHLTVLEERRACYLRYRHLLDRYQAEAETPTRFAPFQLIATEKRAYFDRTHKWHMDVLHALASSGGEPFIKTPFRFLALDDQKAVAECVSWWDELSMNADEGLVVKPLFGVPRGRRGLAQPAIKCRTSEHLRLVYGPEYDLIDNRWQLVNRDAVSRRREKHKRVLKQLALSIEGVERFVGGDSIQSVETCVRALLSLER